jgi:hypothetical protein
MVSIPSLDQALSRDDGRSLTGASVQLFQRPQTRLKPGESQQVDITVSPRTQSVWDTSATDWRYIPDAVAGSGLSHRTAYFTEGLSPAFRSPSAY